MAEQGHLQPLSRGTGAGAVPPFRTQQARGGWCSSDTLQLGPGGAGKKLDIGCIWHFPVARMGRC